MQLASCFSSCCSPSPSPRPICLCRLPCANQRPDNSTSPRLILPEGCLMTRGADWCWRNANDLPQPSVSMNRPSGCVASSLRGSSCPSARHRFKEITNGILFGCVPAARALPRTTTRVLDGLSVNHTAQQSEHSNVGIDIGRQTRLSAGWVWCGSPAIHTTATTHLT